MSTMNVLAAVPAAAKPSAGRAPQTVATDEFSALLAGLVSGLAPVTVPPVAAQTGEASASPATPAGAGAATSAEVPVAPAAAPSAPAAAPSAAAPSAPAAAAPTATSAVPGIAAATPTPAGAPEAASTTRADVAVLTGGPAAPAPLMQGKATAPAAPRPHDPVLPPPAVMQRPVALDGVPLEPAPVEAETAVSTVPTASGEHPQNALDEPAAAPTPAPAGAREPAPVSSVLPVQDVAAAPVAEVRALASPVAPAPAAPAAPPATQVLTQLAPVLEGPDGSYTMSLKLYPEELGAVQVEISLRGGEISVAMHAADDVSKELLRSSLADLRAQLEAHGLSAADLSVDSGRPDERDEPAAQRPRTRRDADDADDAPTPASAPDPDAALDLRM